MAGNTLSTADAILKEDYQPVVRDQLNNANTYSAQLKRTDEGVSGRQALLALHTDYNEGVGARKEGEDLPEAGTTGWVNEKVPVYKNTGRLQISVELIKSTIKDPTSFVRGLQASTDDLKNSAARDYNRQLFGTSDGVIATCGTTTADDVIILAAATTTVQMRQLRKNMKVDIGTVADPDVIVAAAKILSVDIANKTITIDSNVTTSSSHRVFRAGSGGSIAAGSGQREVTGLRSLISDSVAVHNIDPATTEVWKSYVKGSVGSISDLVFETAMDEVDINSGKAPNLAIASHGVRRAYAATLQNIKRINDTVELKGGFSGVSVATPHGTLTLTSDRDCPAGTVFGLDMNTMTEFFEADWEFMDMDGAVLSRVPNKTDYEATLLKLSEQSTDQRNANFILTGVTEASA